MIKKEKRKAVVALLFILYCAPLSAHYYAGYEWKQSNRPPLIPSWHVLASNDVRVKCAHFNSIACEVFDLKAGVCNVYASQSEKDSPDWLRWHAYLHCAGWDHE